MEGAEKPGDRCFACAGLGRRGGERERGRALGAVRDEDEEPECDSMSGVCGVCTR